MFSTGVWESPDLSFSLLCLSSFLSPHSIPASGPFHSELDSGSHKFFAEVSEMNNCNPKGSIVPVKMGDSSIWGYGKLSRCP